MHIVLPEVCLVVLIGASGSGKSTFARRLFRATEVVASDWCRGLVADDENDQSASTAAFELLHFLVGKRLATHRLTVVDATNVQSFARQNLVRLAREHDVLPVAIVMNLRDEVCHLHNRDRVDRQFGPHVVRHPNRDLRRSLRDLRREGFRYTYTLTSPDQIAAATIERQPLLADHRHETGPFDLIGDVHGCYDELVLLLEKLGYTALEVADDPVRPALHRVAYRHAAGRRALFLGDLVDRGPRNLDTLQLAMNMVRSGTALCVPGNHDAKLVRKLQGRDVTVAHGLELTLAELDALPADVRDRHAGQFLEFLDGLVSHRVLDGGKLVAAHAGMKQQYQGRASRRVRDFALYGETTGEIDEFGLPVRLDWVEHYRGPTLVVFGHTPVPEPARRNGTINIDTGCVFGGGLTALRYPEQELVSVPAARVYCEPTRPFAAANAPNNSSGELPDLDDVLGKRRIHTALLSEIHIRPEQSAAALEVLSRFTCDPRWLIYLPPTMSPVETSSRPDLLEHPEEAFAYFAAQNVPEVVCEEKHMGSRAVVIVVRDADAAAQRFGVADGRAGVCLTRTGRPFFTDRTLEDAFLNEVRGAVTRIGGWEEWQTDWICLDAELLPWSAKAQGLLQRQYAPAGVSSEKLLGDAFDLLRQTSQRVGFAANESLRSLQERVASRYEMVLAYRRAYRQYCWPVSSLADLRLAPFHLLATEGRLWTDCDHVWHMEIMGRLADASPLFRKTPSRVVVPHDPASVAAASEWWADLTSRGGEGIVVKPREWNLRGPKGLVQPALKVRGREYLRIIYGPEYTAPEHLTRLRRRSVGGKRALALREYALGLEGLARFVNREPLRRVHECAYAVLALESEPVDPRL